MATIHSQKSSTTTGRGLAGPAGETPPDAEEVALACGVGWAWYPLRPKS